jgi:hypothetical protein
VTTFATKAADPLPPPVTDPTADPQAPPPAPEEGDDSAVGWSGDEVQPGEEGVMPSDPAAAYARFVGDDGLTAWFDKLEDGTLVGWVREADGSVFRYVDPMAWAKDVEAADLVEDTGEDLTGDTDDMTDDEEVDVPADEDGIDSALEMLDGLTG